MQLIAFLTCDNTEVIMNEGLIYIVVIELESKTVTG